MRTKKMIGQFEIKALFNIYEFLEVERSANKIKVLGRRYKNYAVLKIDLNEDQTVGKIEAFYFDYFSDAKSCYLKVFED